MKTFYIILALTLRLVVQTTYSQEAPKSELIDSFNYSNSEDGSARIDSFRGSILSKYDSIGLVIVYGGKVIKKGEIEAHIRGLKETFKRKMDPSNFKIIKGGFREKLTVEFWVVPAGTSQPKPTPTIDAKKVRIKGVSKRVIPYDCC